MVDDNNVNDVNMEDPNMQDPPPPEGAQGQQGLPPGQPPLPLTADQQMVLQLQQELAAAKLQQQRPDEDLQNLFLKTSSYCKFDCFDGSNLDKLSLDMFYTNVDMHVKGLPEVVKINIFVSKLQGQPRETLDQKLKTEPGTSTYEGCKQALRQMYQAHDPVAKSEALLRSGFKQGRRTVIEYVQAILPHLRRCRSSMPDQVDYLLKGLNNEGFRMGVSTCQSTRDYEWPDIEMLSAHIMQSAKRMDAVVGLAEAGPSKGGSANGRSRGRGKAALGAQGGIRKPKPNHAPSLPLKDRISLRSEGRCYACKEKGHIQTDTVCPRHPDHKGGSGSKN